MPDSPDYARYRVSSQRVSLDDMGELSVRLGAVSRIYRDGTTILADDFRYGLMNWLETGGGVGSDVSLTAVHSFGSPYSARFTIPDVAGAFRKLETTLSVITTGKIGFDLDFLSGNSYCQLTMSLEKPTAILDRLAQIRFNPSTNKIEYWSAGGTFVAVSNLPFDLQETNVIHFCKLTVDFDNLRYGRLILDDTIYDLSALSFQSFAATANPWTVFGLTCTRIAGNSALIDVGHIILTQNEVW